MQYYNKNGMMHVTVSTIDTKLNTKGWNKK